MVESLRPGLGEINVIETMILPGSRAPRGHAVTDSVLGLAGNVLRVWRGGRWREVTAWSNAKKVTLAPGLERNSSYIAAPDLVLFPAHFGALRRTLGLVPRRARAWPDAPFS